MSKRIFILASACLALLAGTIWVAFMPNMGILVAILEGCAGFGCGFFYAKEMVNSEATALKNEIESLKQAQKAVKEERKIRISTKRVDANKETPATPAESKKNSKK